MNWRKWFGLSQPGIGKGDTLTLTDAELYAIAGGGLSNITGKSVTESNLMSVSPVWSAIRIISETIGTLPIHLYKRTDNGRERDHDHSLYRLLHTQPNPFMTSVEWREAMAVSLCVWGQSYNRVDRVGRFVGGIMPVPKTAVTATRENGAAVYSHTENGVTTKLTREQILPIKGFGSAVDMLEGYPPYIHHKNAIGLAMVAEEFAARFFGSDARPSGILLGEHNPTPAQRDQMNDLLSESARKLLVLGGNYKYQTISSNNEEAQLQQTRKMQIAEIARVWRVPLHMLMEMDRATYNNTEQENIHFLNFTLRPYLVRIEMALNTVLLTRAEQKTHYIEFDVKGLLRGDSTARGEFYRNMRMIGAMSINEVRQSENLPKVEGGDDMHVPLNMAPVDQLNAILGGNSNAPP